MKTRYLIFPLNLSFFVTKYSLKVSCHCFTWEFTTSSALAKHCHYLPKHSYQDLLEVPATNSKILSASRKRHVWMHASFCFYYKLYVMLNWQNKQINNKPINWVVSIWWVHWLLIGVSVYRLFPNLVSNI